ncbi:MAG TPA: TRAP transporter small permease subunit [Roseomonas sp.]|nr:TRAP transporter small permease subunit [Roseomonas sp.]
MMESKLAQGHAGAAPSLEGGAVVPGLARRLIGCVTILVRAGVVLALAAVLILTVLQVLDRHFFRSGGLAFDQYARVGLVWLTFLGIAIGFRDRANIRIDLLDRFVPAGLLTILRLVLDLVVLAVALLLLWAGWPLLEIGAFQALMDTPLTYEVMYGALLAGLVLLCLFLVLRLADALTGGRFRLDTKVTHHDHP